MTVPEDVTINGGGLVAKQTLTVTGTVSRAVNSVALSNNVATLTTTAPHGITLPDGHGRGPDQRHL